MNLDRTLFFIAIVLCFASSAQANKISAEFNAGSSSNPARLNQGSGGAFLDIVPKLEFEKDLSDSFVVSSKAEANLKRFASTESSDVGNQNSAKGHVEAFYYPTDVLELSTRLGAHYFDGKSAFTRSDGSAGAIDDRFVSTNAKINGAYFKGSWTAELGGSFHAKRYQTLSYDLSGNSYLNDSNSFGPDIVVINKLSRKWRFVWSSSLRRQNYLDRQADFSDGNSKTVGTNHPLLSTVSHSHTAKIRTSAIPGVRSSTSVTASFEKDLVFGALNSTQFGPTQSFKISLPAGRASIQPTASFLYTQYWNHKSDPVANPKSSPLRSEWDLTAASPVSVPLNRQVYAVGEYAFQKKLSNFSAKNFVEHRFQTGLKVEL